MTFADPTRKHGNGDSIITLIEWKAKAKENDESGIESAGTTHSGLDFYDGMFRGQDTLTADVNERYTVVENTYAQDIEGELFEYPEL